MAKKNNNKNVTIVSDDQPITTREFMEKALLPADSDIENKNKVTVNKAEMANILTIQIQESLQIELQQAKKTLNNLQAQLNTASKTALDRAVENAKKLITHKEFNKNSFAISHRILEIKQSYNINNKTKLAIERGVQQSIRVDIRADYMSDDKNVSMNISVSHEEFFDEGINFYKKIEQCNQVINDITERIQKANNTKYVQAQLNMGLLGSTKNGGTLVANIKEMAENLSKGIFAKNPDVPALPE